MKILIAGGVVIGGLLVKDLISKGHEVIYAEIKTLN